MQPQESPPSQGLLVKYGRPGPRYTSYPSVPHWPERYPSARWEQALADLGERARTDPQHALSLYVHVPFCEKRCLFCGCNVVLSRTHSRGSGYVELIRRELDRVLQVAGSPRLRVCQMHWGGGTPTWLDVADLIALHRAIAERVELLPDREQSIEIDPRVTTMAQLETLQRLGLDRLSMGVQDIDPAVQKAIGRHQSLAQIEHMVLGARALGIRSIAVDLVYGLPHQSVDSFRRTVQTVADLGVDRIAVYQFAYLPTRLKHQRAIDAAVLPDADMRVRLIHAATTTLSRAGYEAIGMDHFALADDELAQARRAGTLRRNFMGYTTRAGTDLLGLGASAISRIGRDFAQSAKAVPEYAAQIEQGRLPVVAGMELSEDDLARERAIQSIMCYGESELPRLSNGTVAQLSPRSWQQLAELERDALVRREGSRVVVTPRGRYFLRNVAMAFDAYLDGEEAAAQFSRTA